MQLNRVICAALLTAAMPAALPAPAQQPGQVTLQLTPIAHHPPLCRRFAYGSARHERNLSVLQRLVAHLARQIARDDATVEHGAMIYVTKTGVLRIGPIHAGDFGAVTFTADPAGDEVIVAAAHTHVRYRYYTADQRQLSAEDIRVGERLLAHPRASSALRLYVIDAETGTVSEYPAAGSCRPAYNWSHIYSEMTR